MLVYWTMFAMPALSTLFLGARRTVHDHGARVGMALLLAVFAVLIGLRWEVGTDWFNYQRTVTQLSYTSFAGTFGYKDPGFGLLTWLSTKAGFGIYGANMFSGIVLMYGLARFAKVQPDPWLAVTAAVPYLIIVVGMNYVRQAAAIGFLLPALIAFERGKFAKFLGWTIAAALFHGTSLCIFALAGIALTRRRKALLIPVILVSAVMFYVLLRSRVDDLYSHYVQAQYQSAGASIRLVMNAFPGLLYLLFRNRFTENGNSKMLWTLFSVASIAMLLIYPLFPSSTALDRLGLYFIPIQLYVFGNLGVVATKNRAGEVMMSYLSISYYGAVLFVWLTFASNARDWLPYHFLPTADAMMSKKPTF